MRSLIACMMALTFSCTAAVTPAERVPAYYWKVTPAGPTAELVTLFCSECTTERDAPVLSVLRDTLGDGTSKTDRLIYVWLLQYSPSNWRQRMLAALPFFYWRVGNGAGVPKHGALSPLMNVSAPLHPVLESANRQLLQWLLFDPMTVSVRATTRAYAENVSDHERIRLEEAISYLRNTPTDGGSGAMTRKDVDTLIARLSLRKRLLGGLVANERIAHIGDLERIEAERVRLRNWEYLRECAERAGLFFEPVSLSSATENYAILWFRPHAPSPERAGADDGPIWRILQIANPWKDKRIEHWQGFTAEHDVNGHREALIPLAAYSLTYPRSPLLMVDFRSEGHLRRHEMLQRGVDQLVSGVLGLSHFANWYYFAGADTYNFVASRRGATLNRAARLDSYAQFRSALELDTELPADLRNVMRDKLDELELNPLAASAEAEVANARARYNMLQQEAQNGMLAKRLDQERREEVAEFGQPSSHLMLDAFLRTASFGAYTHRAKETPGMLQTLNRERRAQADLELVDAAVHSGTAPEVAFDRSILSAVVEEISELLPTIKSKQVRSRVLDDLKAIESTTEDNELREACSRARDGANGPVGIGIATRPRVAGPALIPALDTVN